MAQPTRLAVQLYTLREHTKTPADLAKTLGRLADQGWRAVQASAIGPIEPAELKKILDDNGLTCCATHRTPQQLADDPQKQLADHQMIGCRYTAVGGHFPKPEEFAESNWRKFAADYNAIAAKYEGGDLRLGYHNHSHEWAKLGEPPHGDRAIDVLVSDLDERVWFELDTYWVAHAGADPVAWIDRFAGRLPVVHLKDMGVRPDRSQYMMEVGAGNLNWPAILDACRRAGVEWYVVEQDTCYRDPFDSLALSLENLRGMGMG